MVLLGNDLLGMITTAAVVLSFKIWKIWCCLNLRPLYSSASPDFFLIESKC